MNNTAQSFNAQEKPLFWPILWIFLFYPIGIIWTFLRIHKNSKITGKTLGRNIFFTLVAFATLLMIFGAFIGNDTNNERHFKTGDCTKYVTKTFIGGKMQKVNGRACLEADGSWHIQY